MTSGEPLASNPSGRDVLGSKEGPVPIIRLYGITREGQSVMACVHGFTPYMYASLPSSMNLNEQSLAQLRHALDTKAREKLRGDEKRLNTCVLGIERMEKQQSLLGYHFEETRDFIKIYVAMPSLVPNLKRLFEDGFAAPGLGNVRGQTYESNVPFVLRFMIDMGISGADWVELPVGTFAQRQPHNMISRCSVEVDVFFDSIVTHPSDGIWSAIAPLRILSFDIECQGRKGHFPDAQHDPVIQIANTVTLQGSDKPIIRNVFTLGSCLPIVGAQVISSATEEEMLQRWREFVVACDPDVLTGYNIANFDIPYLLNRAKVIF
jgi:DNA polymerase delta subunit 1